MESFRKLSASWLSPRFLRLNSAPFPVALFLEHRSLRHIIGGGVALLSAHQAKRPSTAYRGTPGGSGGSGAGAGRRLLGFASPLDIRRRLRQELVPRERTGTDACGI